MSIAANKVKGVRAAAVSEVYSAKLTRIHNNSNIICFGARVIGIETAKMIVDAYLEAEFEDGGRHAARVDLITKLEENF
jgi:ribose 5-phosphate isomerase B